MFYEMGMNDALDVQGGFLSPIGMDLPTPILSVDVAQVAFNGLHGFIDGVIEGFTSN